MYIKKPSKVLTPSDHAGGGRWWLCIVLLSMLRKVGVNVGQWWGAVAIGRRWATVLLSDMVAIDGCAMSVVDAGGCRGC